MLLLLLLLKCLLLLLLLLLLLRRLLLLLLLLLMLLLLLRMRRWVRERGVRPRQVCHIWGRQVGAQLQRVVVVVVRVVVGHTGHSLQTTWDNLSKKKTNGVICVITIISGSNVFLQPQILCEK